MQKVIIPDGYISENNQIKNKILFDISKLESQVTQRRLREAVLGIDNGWLNDINSQIEELRSQLSQLN